MLTTALALAIALASSNAHAPIDDAGLGGVIDQRLSGDRTGACLAVAVIDGDQVARGYRCADADTDPASRIGPDTAFEIGSVSKTMTAALLAERIDAGEASLDDPLSDHLPPGTRVPDFEGAPIRLRHIVTHTSGLSALPARMQITDPADPYAALTPEALLASLGDITLTRAPGAQFEYSNFASMLLSYALAQRAGQPFETLIDARLFAPLGMERAYITQRPDGVRAATGHLPNGSATPAWTIPGDMAGVGGVRATLDDMVRYVQAQLGQAEDATAAPLLAALQLTHQTVSQQPPMAMHWMIVPLAGRDVLMHEGGTGGFSSLVGLDPAQKRGVVILSDTALGALGGLGSLGAHLLDPSVPPGTPRRLATPPSELVDGLVGTWRFDTGMQAELARNGDALTIHPPGQPVLELAYDDAGDFFPTQFDAVLTPRRAPDGGYTIVWRQGGGTSVATRVPDVAPAAAPVTDVPLADYAGDYTLMPGFVLKVDAADGRLRAQATGQGAFALDATGTDTFAAPAFGLELRFQRGADGEVTALELHQGGQVLRGARS